MAQRWRLTYAPEFCAEALKRVRTSAASVSAIARDLGIPPSTLRHWLDASRPQPEVPLPMTSEPSCGFANSGWSVKS